MQVLFPAVRGMLALSIALLVVHGARSQVQVEDGSGVITMTGTFKDIEVPERLIMVVGDDGTTVVGVISPDVKDIKKIKLKDKSHHRLYSRRGSGHMDMNAPIVQEQD